MEMDSSPPSTEDRGPAIIAATLVLTIFSTLFVSARLWVRFIKTKAHSWDDYFIIASTATNIVSLALTFCEVQYGYGKSIRTLSDYQIVHAFKYQNFAGLMNGFCMAFLKISIGLSLLRLQLGKGMSRIIWGSIVLSVVCNASVMVGTLFKCRPIEAIWNSALLPTASCVSPTVMLVVLYTQTGGNIVTDLFYALGPLYYLSKVKVSRYNKWALRGVFLLGLLATVCAVAKCFELPKMRMTKDPTLDGATLIIWVRAEVNAGLIAAAIPALKAMFEQFLRNIVGVHQSGLQTNPRYGSNSYKRSISRRSRPCELEDDEIAMHSNAAHVHGNAYASHSTHSVTDGHSMETFDQSRKDSKSNGDGSGGRASHGQIMKTVGYTVRETQRHGDA